jgi:hypothetical protein
MSTTAKPPDSSPAKNLYNKTKDLFTKTLKDMSTLKEEFVGNALAFMILLLVGFIIWYKFYLTGLPKSECTKMDILYANELPPLTSMDFSKPGSQFALRDYYIKTAYNCCSAGAYKNDWVDLCALRNILKQGVRCLDFEIYSIDDQPVVATSTVTNYYVKETFNSIPFADCMNVITTTAFTTGNVPNPNDPLIIHLRIKSTNQNMYTNFATLLKGYEEYLLSSHYSYEYTYGTPAPTNSTTTSENGEVFYSHNLGAVKLSEFQKKIIIIVDRINTAFMDNTKFYEFVNMTSNSIFMRALSYYDTKFTPDMNELQEYNKQSMTICMPDSGANPENPSGIVAREMGCQLVAMRFQQFDANLQETIMYFDQAGTAFVLKPEKLRYIQETIPDTPPNPPQLNFATRTIESPYYTINI